MEECRFVALGTYSTVQCTRGDIIALSEAVSKGQQQQAMPFVAIRTASMERSCCCCFFFLIFFSRRRDAHSAPSIQRDAEANPNQHVNSISLPSSFKRVVFQRCTRCTCQTV